MSSLCSMSKQMNMNLRIKRTKPPSLQYNTSFEKVLGCCWLSSSNLDKTAGLILGIFGVFNLKTLFLLPISKIVLINDISFFASICWVNTNSGLSKSSKTPKISRNHAILFLKSMFLSKDDKKSKALS